MPVETLGPQHVGTDGPVLDHPTIEVMTTRHTAGSQREERNDDHTLALAIEGGGGAGIVDAGMCAVIEATRLIDAVDAIYGTSSGALNGLYTAAGRAALGATNYEDIMDSDFATPKHLLKRRPIVDFRYLFEQIIGQRKPVELADLDGGPQFVAVGVNVKTGKAEAFKNFDSTEEMLLAVRASCAMPLLSGFPVKYHGGRITDGAMRAGVPFRLALEGGASHVLALRTRGENYRKDPYKPHEIYLPLLAGGVKMTRLIRERPALYNTDADELQYGGSESVVQIAPEGPDDEPVTQLESSRSRMREGFRLGVEAAGKAFGIPELDVDWKQFPPAIVVKTVA